MLCPNCRQAVPTGSRFCNVCGVTIPAPAVAPPMSPHVVPVTPLVLRPSFLFVAVRYAVAVVGTVAIVIMGALIAGKVSALAGIVPWAVGGLAAASFIHPIARHIQRQMESYTVSPEFVEIRTGVLSRTTRNIPLHKIQDVTTSSKLWERLVGIGDVVIDSASESGKIVLKGIPHPQAVATEILQRLRR